MDPGNVIILWIGTLLVAAGIGAGMYQAGGYTVGAYIFLAGVTVILTSFILNFMSH